MTSWVSAADFAGPAQAFARHRKRQRRVLALLALTVSLTALGAALIGPSASGGRALSALVGSLLDALGLEAPFAWSQSDADILMQLRLPRIAAGLLVGASLGLSGAAMQGLFRNPLVDPGLLGVSSGARLAAVAFLVLGGAGLVHEAPALALIALPLVAFVGALLSVLIVWRIASRHGRILTATLLLAGIALTVLEESATGFLSWIADDEALRLATLWRLGSLGGLGWDTVAMVALFGLTAGAIVLRSAASLDAMALGEADAGHLGIEVDRLKRHLIVATALLVGASVAAAGVIGFVGLISPHLVRLLTGSHHRVVLPASALLGALLVTLADVIARTAMAPAELPLSVIMALLGGPVFLWLVARRAKELSLQ